MNSTLKIHKNYDKLEEIQMKITSTEALAPSEKSHRRLIMKLKTSKKYSSC